MRRGCRYPAPQTRRPLTLPPLRDLREAAQRKRLKVVEGNKAKMGYISSIAHDLAASKGGSARASEEMAVSKDQQPTVLAARSMPAGDVLVVEDTPTVRNLLKRTISRMGQEVDTACTGKVGGLVLCKCCSGCGARARSRVVRFSFLPSEAGKEISGR